MKKLFCILAACFLVAAISTSCKKTCTCETYLNGEVVLTKDLDLDKDLYKKCSDMNTYIDAVKSGLKCK